MFDYQKSFIVHKKRPSVSEREKSHVVVKKKKNISVPVKKKLPEPIHYLESELGSHRHKILQDKKWKYVGSSYTRLAVYKKGDVQIWVERDGKWNYKNERKYTGEWVRIFKKITRAEVTQTRVSKLKKAIRR